MKKRPDDPLGQLFWDVDDLKVKNAALVEALERIAFHAHNTYAVSEQYDIGVTDGHRCAAKIARAALAKAKGK